MQNTSIPGSSTYKHTYMNEQKAIQNFYLQDHPIILQEQNLCHPFLAPTHQKPQWISQGISNFSFCFWKFLTI